MLQRQSNNMYKCMCAVGRRNGLDEELKQALILF